MFSENYENFSFEDCSFQIHKSKESAGRVVMHREFQLIYSYTMESSFCGPTRGSHEGCHFNPDVLMDVGKNFCNTLWDMSHD